MSGYTRQSAADIIPTAVVRAAPINAEFNAIRDAFDFDTSGVTGHRHDGSEDQGSYVPLIADVDGKNKVVIDSVNNRVSFFSEVSGSSVEQLRVQDGVILPVLDNDIDLGSSSVEFKDLYLDGTAKIDTLVVDENTTITGTLGVTGLSTLASTDINAGTVDGTVIGASVPQAITGTNVVATTGFLGALTGDVTGNLTGNSTGTHTGSVVGDITGNVTASSGSSSFTDVTINGTLNLNSGTLGTITGLSTPVNGTDATTKTYVDNADALKLNLSGGTMSGSIAMGANKVTGLGAPTSTADAATKGYVDTSISNLVDSAPGALDTLNELAAALGDDPNFATTVTSSIATKVSKSGDTLTGDLVMGANKVISTATPVTADTLTRKGYVDDQDALKLSLTGGTMSGGIAMGTSKITGLGDPTLAQDAATKTYVDSADATKLNLSGGTMTGNIVMGANKVTSTATPTANDDLTRKAYVDSILGSATSAADSAAAALVSETNAATSASNAATSETNAAASAASAATSETNAAGSASAAATSASNTAISVSAAATSETNAATSASNAATSETNAANSATSAATSATNASNSASAAVTSAGNAATSETNAANSASSAATSEANAAASYDAFDDRYLGAKASAPSVDNDGNALLTGALYWNTSSNNLFVWTGSVWNPAAFDVGTALFDADIGVTVQAYSTVLQNTTASFTTADETKLDGIEAGADVTDTTNVTAAGALMDSELTNITAVKALNQGVATTDSPTFATVNVITTDFGSWTITESGGSLYFATGGTNRMKLDASGNLQITGTIDTVATIS